VKDPSDFRVEQEEILPSVDRLASLGQDLTGLPAALGECNKYHSRFHRDDDTPSFTKLGGFPLHGFLAEHTRVQAIKPVDR